MSTDAVRRFFADHNIDIPIIELETSTATVALAAQAHGVAPGQIAKTLSFRLADGKVVIVVARGDARIDNRKFKEAFGQKGKMLSLEEVEAVTGHPVGGVCPFGLKDNLPVYCDVSLKAFTEVLPAAGAINAAIRVSPLRLMEIVNGQWTDICQPVEAASQAA